MLKVSSHQKHPLLSLTFTLPLMKKLRKLGKLKDFSTGKVGKLQAKDGQIYIAFQHKEGDDPIFLSEELQDKIDKEASTADIKKALKPFYDKCKIGQIEENFVAFLGGDFEWV